MMSQFEDERVQLERERIILEEIRNNPKIHHNALVKIIVPKHMAKTTFEKTRDVLVEKNILLFTMKGNKKFYDITQNYQIKATQLIEKFSHLDYQYLQHETKRFQDNYQHKDLDEKIFIANQLLRKLFKVENNFTFLDAIKNSKRTLYKDEHLEIQEMISLMFKIITKEKESEIILPTVLSSIGFNFSLTYEARKL